MYINVFPYILSVLFQHFQIQEYLTIFKPKARRLSLNKNRDEVEDFIQDNHRT